MTRQYSKLVNEKVILNKDHILYSVIINMNLIYNLPINIRNFFRLIEKNEIKLLKNK